MSKVLDDLIALLDLERLEDNLFRGLSPNTGWRRVFGGQVIGQALVAACRTVDAAGRQPHSLHAYFLLPGDPSIPILYEVDRIRDGRSFATRRVKAIQRGQAIFSLSASFQAIEADSFAHQMPMPPTPAPDTLETDEKARAERYALLPEPVRRFFERERPIELRPATPGRFDPGAGREPASRIWIRANGTLPDDPVLHQCVLAYASDMTLLDTAMAAHGRTLFDPAIQAASLDHALWFHRPFRADQWLLYAQDSPFTGGGRGLTRGTIYSTDGVLVASVAQEGLLRLRTPKPGV